MASTLFQSVQGAGAALSSSSGNLTGNASNTTSSLIDFVSHKRLFRIPFQFLARTDRFLFRDLPEYVVRQTGIGTFAHHLVDFVRGGEAGEAAAAVPLAHTIGHGQRATDAAGSSWTSLFTEAFQTSTFKSYWGMLHYLTSRWAFTCFVMALILNRISVYGSSRQRIFLTWNKRLALRLIPILLFVTQIRQLLQAIRCQTSPDYSLYRHGDNDKYSVLDWSTDGGIWHKISSTLLYWSDDAHACSAVGMSRPEPAIKARYGSFSLLWPTFLRLSVSHFIENLSCSLQQIPVMTEVGISVFEHSLAFAEAETMVSHALGIGMFHVSNISTSSSTTTTASQSATTKITIPASGTILAITDAAHALTGPHLFDKVNVPIEVLIVALLSCCNSLTSHMISVLGKQRHWRLINTAIWGICFMCAFIWGFFTTSSMVRNDGGATRPVSGLLHFPTVAIVGFLPHMTIILGIIICGIIYLMALLLTAVSLGTNSNIRQPTSLAERITIAHNNLQVAIQMKGISLRWYEDFYTALLRIGFASLTAASEAVFLNEGRSVEMRQFTWLEEERLDEIEASKESKRPNQASDFQIVEEYGVPGPGFGTFSQNGQWQSGYARERKVDKPKNGELQNKDSFVYPNPRTDGVGALQRTTRFYLLFIFLRGILFTVGGWFAYAVGAFLDRIGITARPNWLRSMVGNSLKHMKNERQKLLAANANETLEFWFVNSDGKLEKPKSDEVDIEPEMRKRLESEEHNNSEEELDQKMYDWWKAGGWYGTKDESGEYQPSIRSREDDEDVTSVVSFSTSASEANDDGWESESEGRRTPTQNEASGWSFHNLGRERSQSPPLEAPILDHATLARLLDPPDRKSREEARLLASHFGREGIMTRSRYRQHFQNDRAKILLAGRTRPSTTVPALSSNIGSSANPLTNDEEAEVLEQLIIDRRQRKKKQSASQNANMPETHHNEPSQQAGPPCVVCQAEPRTIIAWPCRCLTVCEDCRVSLAMNNFGNCVTCRRSVGGFVRLYVP